MNEVRRIVEDLVHAAARAIDDDKLEEFPNFFVADGVYKVASRFNAERGLPLAHIYCTNRGMITDRIASIRKANIYQPHRYRHLISGIHVERVEGDVATARANYLVLRIMDDGATAIFSSGEYRDAILVKGGAALFRERVVLFDSKSIETLLAIPL